MIGKIKKGKSFGGCVRYVMGKDDAKILASDGVLLGTNREMIDSFNCQDDPLNQRASVGWKGMRAAERLVEQYMVRIESVSSYSATAAAN